MAKYLYGAAVQGIQSFIFQTNDLKDIIGASELVEYICKDLFEKTIQKLGGKTDPSSWILSAAGNIKYQFVEEDDLCKKVYREFPRIVLENAPGITISQAVIEFSDEDFSIAVQELEQRLRAKRNVASRPSPLGLMAFLRSRQTGLPVTRPGFLDEGTFRKINVVKDEEDPKRRNPFNLATKAFDESSLSFDNMALNISDITEKNDWIAIIHADGNGLGQVVSKIGHDKGLLRSFSQLLDDSTKSAAKKAYLRAKTIGQWGSDDVIPIRPVVLGGDDLTVICRGDFALEYVEEFLKSFEEETSLKMKDVLKKAGLQIKGLTACAGIAFVKSSFPFYYGYELAESLCSAAKKVSKEIDSAYPPSSLMFHKVQDSFISDYDDISSRELRPNSKSSFKFGPYFLKGQKGYWAIAQLLSVSASLVGEEENAIRSNIRNWMSLLTQSDEVSAQRLDRIRAIHSNKDDLINMLTGYRVEAVKENGENISLKVYPAYDVLAINTVKTQITQTPKKGK